MNTQLEHSDITPYLLRWGENVAGAITSFILAAAIVIGGRVLYGNMPESTSMLVFVIVTAMTLGSLCGICIANAVNARTKLMRLYNKDVQ